MNDIFHPVLDNNSVFKIRQIKDESILYSDLAALYLNRIDAKQFTKKMHMRNTKSY